MLTADSDECDSKLLEDGGHRRSMLPYVPSIRVTAQARWLNLVMKPEADEKAVMGMIISSKYKTMRRKKDGRQAAKL